MRGIRFDNVHSYDDLNLLLSVAEIPPATAKTNYIDIPGGDGSVDLTEALGEVKFKDRECAFTFTVFPQDDFEVKKRQISNLLNGKVCKIALDKDPGYYWQGRCSINEYASDKNIHKIVVGAVVAPYKLKEKRTNVSVSFCGKNLLDTSAGNQITQRYGETEFIENGFRKSGSYFAGFRAHVAKNTDYSLSVNIKKITEASTAASGGRIAVYNTANTISIAQFPSGNGDRAFSFNSGDYTEINVLFYSDSSETVGVYEFTNIQLEPGEATPYEAFTPVETKEITLTNRRMTVCPSVTCTNDNTKFTLGGLEFTLSKGTHTVPEFQLYEGETPVTLTGTGAVNFDYQEGDL